MLKINKPASLYIHVPFCEAKCFYCSFYSIKGTEQDFLTWLENIKSQAQKLCARKIQLNTIYIGGGTPSILSLKIWRGLLNFIHDYFDVSTCLEFTVEANPNSLSRELLSLWKNFNVTRISLGVQSLNNDELKILGRLHDVNKALKAMELVKNFNFILSADLIFAIPGQNIRTWHNSLTGVINSGVDHISTYQLTLEPDTKLAREKNLTNSDLNKSGYYFYRYTQYLLPKKNFLQYEISSFAPENFECKHNLAYWTHKNIIALGESAAGYFEGTRYKISIEDPNKILLEKKLSRHDQAIEFAILNLRTKFGIDRHEFISRFDLETYNEIKNILSNLPNELFCNTSDKIILSQKGMRLGNAIWSELI